MKNKDLCKSCQYNTGEYFLYCELQCYGVTKLVNVLYAALGTLEYQGQINELEARRLHSLLSAMHRRWINTGCWKPYGEAEEQDEKERRKSQDVNS